MRARTALAALLSLTVLLPLAGVPARAEQVTELDAAGKLKAKYSLDESGLRHGGYAEFHTDGSIKVKATYRRGKLHGRYVSYHPGGRPHVAADYDEGGRDGKYVEKDEKGRVVVEATYVKGRLHGAYEEFREGEPVTRQRWADGVPLDVDGVKPYPKSREEIRATIEEIFNSTDPLESAAGDPEAWGRGECLRQLKIYRYLCDVPWRELQLDAEMNRLADAGAALCERIGRLDHTPENPGLPEDEYKTGYRGTSNSNLYQGQEDIVPQVRGYMDDSDARNIDRVGHRRWCLNPPLQKTGFGRSGRFGAMWSMDRSNAKAPDYELVAFPPPGWMPDYYFAEHYAWSVSLHRQKFKKPDPAAVKVTVTPLGDDHVRRDPPLPLNHLKVDTDGPGIPYCVIFRPTCVRVEPGARYWVEITGLETRDGPAAVRYVVAFFEL